MRIDVQFFSRLRDIVAASEISLDLPADASLADLLRVLYSSHPALQEWDAHLLLAVGLEYSQRDRPLHEADVVSIMPPVQGG